MSKIDVAVETGGDVALPSVPTNRERWSSRTAFYFAAIGSAVGFGNIWRFPSLVYEYGGGAFFIPYILALVFIGLPILVLEIALGQYYESGDVEVFGGIHRRLRGVGLSSIACGYMLVTYYSMLIAWVTNAFFDTFGKSNFWSGEVTGSEANSYFINEIIGTGTVGENMEPTRLVWKNVGYSFLVWIVVYLCVAFGVKVTGRITYFTMGFPVVLLFIMLGRAVSLEGASEGIDQYLNTDLSVLTEKPEIWPKAVAQIFFSLSICFGIMTAYASHQPRNSPAVMNACVIAISNSCFSFVSGFAVFATLGYLSNVEGVSISELNFSGFGLVFGSFPVALGTLPGGEHWIRLFFVMLFLLGIDSAFSFVEAFLVCLQDASSVMANIKPKTTCFIITIVAWLFSLLYATDAGLFFLDTVDYYINFVMILVGFFQCFAAGWIYNFSEQIDNLGSPIVFSFIATYFGSTILACVLWFSVPDASTALWAGFVGFALFFCLGMAFTLYLMKVQINAGAFGTIRSMMHDLLFRNMIDLKDDLSVVVGKIPLVWAVLIKFVIPPVLLALFSLGCAAKTSSGQTEFGHYGGYPGLPYQLLGILTVVFAGFLFFSSLIMPRLYDAFEKTESPVPTKDFTLRASATPAWRKSNETGATSDEPADVNYTLEATSPGEQAWTPRSPDEKAEKAVIEHVA